MMSSMRQLAAGRGPAAVAKQCSKGVANAWPRQRLVVALSAPTATVKELAAGPYAQAMEDAQRAVRLASRLCQARAPHALLCFTQAAAPAAAVRVATR